MWGEARGYGEQGMLAIGCVILNRVKWDHHATGHGIHGVCHKHKQFSCWNPGDNNYQKMLDLAKLDDHSPDWQAWVLANQIAGKLLAGAYKDITGGATHYHTETMVAYWVGDMIPTGVMFGHIFYKIAPHHPHHNHRSHLPIKNHHHGKSPHKNH
jgi:spore germination cell wall hydrolase CwlJ-like protein